MAKPHILIIGAGLGGLTTAIALVQRGFAVDVYEQAPALAEVGAGLTISRSCQLVFDNLGLLDRIRQTASITARMAFLHYASGRLLAGDFDRSDGNWHPDKTAGGIHIHRADLHAMLAACFSELAPGCLHLGAQLAGFDDNGSSVSARFANGASAIGDLLVGGDGIRSAVRTQLWGADKPRFTGQVAYRFMVPGDAAAPFLASGGRAAVFLGPERVFNRYTLRGGAIVNCVGITRSESWAGEGWFTPASIDEMLALYDGWHGDVTGLMQQALPAHLIKWALFDRPPLPGWLKGRVTLLGDAAHPMLPFLGMGAAMAIEDAMVFARALADSPDLAGLARYEAIRRPRVDLIAELSRVQGEISQARDPDAYDPASAPAQDPSIQSYDPVTIALEQAA